MMNDEFEHQIFRNELMKYDRMKTTLVPSHLFLREISDHSEEMKKLRP